MLSFSEFFHSATENNPYPYQQRVAQEGLPPVLEAPTGAGKTGVVLAWLWRLLHKDQHGTPRRLIYALPQRALVEQVADTISGWLASLGLSDAVALHVVMGGAGTTQFQWRRDMHRPAIVVGTVDSLVSKALNRGYGIARSLYPIDFALVTNGAHWIVDEIQLCPESTTTLRQLAAFTASLGTAEPFGLTCMSATIPQELIGTVDNPAPPTDTMIGITQDDRHGHLGARLAARRTVRRLPADADNPRAVAEQIAELHRAGTLTLAVVNTVKTARALYAAVRRTPAAGQAECVLLHSRFRAADRSALMRRLKTSPGPAGRIVVATQVVEAGIDISARTLLTEAAPWPSVVQRAGRCNRYAEYDDAHLWWLPPASHHPYPEKDVAAASEELTALEGVAITGEELQQRAPYVTEPEVSVLRRRDLLGLFDTAPDLSGQDIDVSPYVRDAEDSDVQVAWAVWKPTPGRADIAAPPDDAVAPTTEHRCRVPIGELARFKVPLWRRDPALGRWMRAGAARPPRPGEVLVVAATDGGYHPDTGFDPTIKQTVPDSPTLLTKAERAAGDEEPFGEDSAGDRPKRWVPLDEHLRDTRDQAHALLAVIQTALPEAETDAVVRAAYLHDAGKTYPGWQDALCALATEDARARIDAGRPWAKSDVDGQLRVPGGAGFRHELVSLLLLDGPLSGLLDDIPAKDLVRYLVLAHHGKLRVQVRDLDAAPDGSGLLGLRDGDVLPLPAVLDWPGGDLTIDLEQFTFGGDQSWTRTALALRDKYGPFRLAYLETLVRIADWRASADDPLPTAGPPAIGARPPATGNGQEASA